MGIKTDDDENKDNFVISNGSGKIRSNRIILKKLHVLSNIDFFLFTSTMAKMKDYTITNSKARQDASHRS
jgi:hypothetical protein